MKILLDTNFLIDLFRFKVDTTELVLHQLYTISPVVEELKALSSRKGKGSRYAKLALKLVEKINVIPCEGDADACLLKLAKDFAVATNDRELRKKLKEKNAKIIYLRAKKKVVL
jgi:rRNA-processing protein FCF1